VILDDQPSSVDPPEFTWQPTPGPSPAELVVGAVVDNVRRPGQIVDAVRHGIADVADTAAVTARTFGRVVATAQRLAGGSSRSPLTGVVTPHRRYAMITTDLDDYREIRSRVADPAQGRRGGRRTKGSLPPAPVTINDVVLAVLAGALRAWLLARAEPVPPGSLVRTLAPMSVRNEEPESNGSIGTRVDSALVDLPTGEASPMMRLHQISYQTKALPVSARAVDAPTLAGIAGFAPPTLHSLGARVASGLSRRMFDLVVTNVPGPQQSLYADDARMVATYPVVPLASGQALSIGLTSYAGKVYYGLNADREALPDVDVVGHCIVDALAELLEAVR
jgi:hypothetical protein